MRSRVWLPFIFLILQLNSNLFAQCSCTDCPINTISNGTVTSTLNISGSTNQTLGQNDQELLSIYLDYDTDAINEVNVTLYAPNGSSVLLIQETGLNVSQNINFKICFNYCDGMANPDPGFSEFFDSAENWNDDNNYSGSYYPTGANLNTLVGCFESLTGSINGDWVLEIQDVVGQDDGTINDWFLVFTDNSGTECTDDFGCTTSPLCEADAGEIDDQTVEFCEGDPSLSFTLPPDYGGDSPPDPSEYTYTYAISIGSTNTIISFSDNPDLSGFMPGVYNICGFSYLTSDESLIPTPNGTYSTNDLEDDIDDGLFCGNLTEDCKEVIISEEPMPTIDGPLTVCANNQVIYAQTNLQAGVNYSWSITQGSFTNFNPSVNSASVVWTGGPATICVEASNSCGTVIDCIDIIVNQEPEEITIDGPTSVCFDEISNYIVSPTISGSESYNITVTGGTIFTQTNNFLVIQWNDPSSAQAEICIEIIGSGCPTSQSCFNINVALEEIPNQISLNNLLCIGQEDFAAVPSNPNILNYNWTLTNLTAITGNGSPTINYSALAPGLATVCLEIETICGFEGPICENIQVIQAPEPDIFLTSTICDYTFTVTAMVASTSTLNWTNISGPENVMIVNPTNQSTQITVDQPGTYEFLLEEDNLGCIGINSITLEVLPPLELILLDFDCNADQNYTVLINLTGGEAPYSINGNEINGTSFTSVPIASEGMYNFIITDNQDCELPPIVGTFECPCSTDSGSMDTTTLEDCAEIGNSVQALEPQDINTKSGDIGMFFLHDNAGSSLGNIIEFNFTGIFEFTSTITPGQTYYISYVVGQELYGTVDLDNPCTSVSPGQAVIFYPKPNTDIIIPENQCGFTIELILTNQFFLEDYSWEFINGPGDEPIINVIEDTSIFSTETYGIYSYNLILNNAFCDTVFSVEFEVLGDIDIENILQECSFDPAYYTLDFDILNGEAPYIINIEGDIEENHITADSLLTDSIYLIEILDANNCSFSFNTELVNCSCEIQLGTFNTDTILLCEGNQLNPSLMSNQDFVFDNTIYQQGYYIYENQSDDVENFITFSYGQLIDQSPLFIVGEIYYIRMLIALPDINPDNGLLLTDACLTISEPVPVKWIGNFNFDFPMDITACTTESIYSWEQTYPGPFPYIMVYESPGFAIIEQVISGPIETNSFPIYEGTYIWNLIDVEGQCDYTFNGNITVTGITDTIPELLDVDTLCNNAFFGSTLLLSDILVQDNLGGSWYFEGNLITDTALDFEGFMEGSYELLYTNEGVNAFCSGGRDSTEIYIKDCNCPIVLMSDQASCDSEGSINLSSFVQSNSPGVFSIQNPDNLVNLPDINGIQIDFSNADEGTYTVLFTMTDEWPAECEVEFMADLTVENQQSAGQQIEFPQYCRDEVVLLDLFDIIQDYDDGGTWNIGGIVTGSEMLTVNHPEGDNIFTYTLEADSLCLDVVSEVVIPIFPQPTVSIIASDVLCFGDTNGSIEVVLENENFGPYTCTLNSDENVDKVVNDLPPGTYIMTVTNSEGCQTVIDSIIIEEPDVVEVELGEDLLAFYDDEFTIEAIINLLSSDVKTVTWEDLTGIINTEDLTLIQNAIQDNTITLTITDDNGCIAFDMINIRLIDFDIILPNIFNPNSPNQENQVFGVPFIPSIDQVDEFAIYDRWGNQVFYAENIISGDPNVFWDGMHNGEASQQGVYAYYLKYTTKEGKQKFHLGNVTLVR